MNKQFKKSETTKAVAAGVQKGGILDSPRGQWHNWESEVFVYMQKLILILSLIALYNNLTANDCIKNEYHVHPVKENIIDLEPIESRLNVTNIKLIFVTKSKPVDTLVNILSQSGDPFSSDRFYMFKNMLTPGLGFPLKVKNKINCDFILKEHLNQVLINKSKTQLIVFDESQKKDIELIVNRKNDIT